MTVNKNLQKLSAEQADKLLTELECTVEDLGDSPMCTLCKKGGISKAAFPMLWLKESTLGRCVQYAFLVFSKVI